MIISHKHKFVFLKTKKTAGTSIEISLSRYCGEDDIITPISLQDEAIRKLLGKKPQNYTTDSVSNYYNHIPAEEVKNLIGDEVWNNYYKFCFERNPFEKAISWYYFKTQSSSMENFDSWLKEFYVNYPTPSCFHIYTINSKVAVDFIGRYENLAANLAEVCNRISVPFDGWLPNAKGFFRKERTPYYEILNAEQISIISEVNKNTLDLLRDYQHHSHKSKSKNESCYQKTASRYNQDYYEKMAIDLIKQGQVENALTVLSMAIGLEFEKYWCYWHTLGNLYREKHQYNRAINAYQKAIKLGSSFSWSYYNLGDCLEKQGNTKDAVQAFAKSTELYPNFTLFSDRLVRAKSKV